MSFEKGGQMALKKRKRTSAKLEFDESKEISVASKTGKVLYGSKSVVSELASGTLKMIIIANNTPKPILDKISNLNDSLETPVPLYVMHGSSWDLGSICGKPYWISTLGIIEVGDSSILKVITK
jgi:large subunit ribosomal protein L30e